MNNENNEIKMKNKKLDPTVFNNNFFKLSSYYNLGTIKYVVCVIIHIQNFLSTINLLFKVYSIVSIFAYNFKIFVNLYSQPISLSFVY